MKGKITFFKLQVNNYWTHRIVYLIMLLGGSFFSKAAVIYVNPSAGGANNGTSWTNGYTSLHTALSNANAGDQLWLIEGVYRPTQYPSGCTTGCDSNLDYAFKIPTQVAIIGGFNGTETSIDQRDLSNHETILSGDVDYNGPGGNGDVNHILLMLNVSNVIIEGVIIEGGAQNSSNGMVVDGVVMNDRNGEGIYAYNSDFILQNSIIRYATSSYPGLAIFADNCDIDLYNCIIHDNGSSNNDPAVYLYYSTTVDIVNTTFYNNPVVINECTGCTVTFNNSIAFGNAVQFSQGTVDCSNSILQDLTSVSNITGNLVDVDPLFTDAPGGDFSLLSSSPAIEAGNSTLLPNDVLDLDNDAVFAEDIPFDLKGNIRSNGTPDIGAIEHIITRIYVDIDAVGNNNGTSWANAFSDFTDALNYADSITTVEEIWVAEGTYYPTSYPRNCVSNCTSSDDYMFHLPGNVKIYGGFDATETSLEQRNYSSHLTILSGDLDQSGTPSAGDAIHVLFALEEDSIVLDGFTIT